MIDSKRLYVLLLLVIPVVAYQYAVKIFPNVLSQNGRTTFESDRWNGHNGLDDANYIAGNLAIGSRTGRWLNPDLNFGVFPNATEDPSRPGYADPHYFASKNLQQRLSEGYAANVKGYGGNLTLVMETKCQFWPSWLDTSMHGGVFPNNLDAASDMILMMVEAVYNYTGVIPPYFEVINEPETLYKNVNWDIIKQFHQLVAEKLHAKFPYLKVCGPTNDGYMEYSDFNDFQYWQNDRAFMDMSLYDLDIFSFHPYNAFYSENGKHNFTGSNEERFIAFLDLVESYAFRETGKHVPVIVSEYGLGRIFVDTMTTKAMVQWAYIYLHNAHMFTYLNHRGVMEKAVAFLLCVDPHEFGNSSLFYANGTETPVAQVYRFWGHLTDSDHFLRVESEFSGSEKTVSFHAVVNPDISNVTVLLHNYATSSVDISFDFVSNWAKPTSAVATCMFLDSDGIPVYATNETTTIKDSMVHMGPESSCFFAFHITDYNFHTSPVFVERTLYAKDVVIKIVNNLVKSTVFVPSVIGIQSVVLRIGVSNSNKTAQTAPTGIQLSGRSCDTGAFFTPYGRDELSAQTQWKVYTYKVPADVLIPGDNDISLEFPQSGGYVSSIAFLVGSMSTD